MKNIYITWHYTTHGVAYLKHVLSQFYKTGKLPNEIRYLYLEQEELNLVFDEPNPNNFLFDEIIYLISSQESFDKLSNRRFAYKKDILEDEQVIKLGLKQVFEEIINNDAICYHLEEEFTFVQNKYPDKFEDFQKVIWRNIQYYPIEEQIKWLTQYSNFKNVYADRLKIIDLKVSDFRNEKEICQKLGKWAKKYFSENKKVQPIINVTLGTTETQVVWHILAESGYFPESTRFIKTYDDKRNKSEKNLSIKQIPVNLLSSIIDEFKIFQYEKTNSISRELVNKKMQFFLKSGFSILLLGERGTGKSRIASEAKKRLNKEGVNIEGEIIEANCASFDDDSKAEAELFGYVKGAFTGANADKTGLIKSAEKGILFLDEVHHLSKFVQAKLMKALQTDEQNHLSIRPLGSNKEIKVKDVRLIFATNKPISELKNILLPDFYDRIVQHVIHIPSLRETPEDRETDWETVWKELKFKNNSLKVPKEKEFLEWLKSLPLYGNFRDLQKIAMYYNIFNEFEEETKKILKEKTAFQYAKNEFEKYHSSPTKTESEKFNFNTAQTTKEMIADYLYELQKWAVEYFGGRKKAVEHFKLLGDTVTEKTLNDWKNRKSVKKQNKDTLE